MSSHSEEVWESFDALWQQLGRLSSRVKELEARIASIESEGYSEGRTPGPFQLAKEKVTDERSN